MLVADDEVRLLRLMERVIASHGYAVLTARDGDEALPRFEAMLDARPDLGVVVTSGGLRADEPPVLRRPGVIWLPKPFPSEALTRAVADALAPHAGKK